MRHTIRLWVYDRPGVLDRITGVIRRRGVNINTLTSGDTLDGVAQITITLGAPVNLKALCQTFTEMSSVQHWEECTPETHVVRELLLLRCASGQRELLPEGAHVFQEEEGVLFADIVAAPDRIGELIRTLRENDIACVRTGALGLSKRAGSI